MPTDIEVLANWYRGQCSAKSLKGHKSAVLTVQMFENHIISSSKDATVRRPIRNPVCSAPLTFFSRVGRSVCGTRHRAAVCAH
jgi:hypothetical protein